MAAPKQRHNSSRTRRRRKHNIQKIKDVQTQECKSCGVQKLPHRVCDACGTYRGVEYVQKVKKADA